MPALAVSSRKWMQGSSGSLRGALLGLVLERPGHGGELASRLARRLGDPWRIDPTDVYRLLGRLVDDGLVCTSEEPGSGESPRARVIYHPTELTREALTLWLETLIPREPMRSSLQAKLAAAHDAQDARLLMRTLEAHERDCLALAKLLPAMATAPTSWKSLFLDCVRSGVISQLQAEIDWYRHTRQRIAEFFAETRHST